MAVQSGVTSTDRLLGGGTDGNERLTAVTGIALVAPLAVIGVTLLRLHGLLWVHLFVGLLLIGPVLLKLASTGYRFVRYYTRDPPYRHKGPPEPALRMLAPLVVLTTLVVFASGVALLLIGPSSRSALLPVHKISFIVWGVVTALHVLGHLSELPQALGLRREVLARGGSDASWRLTSLRAGAAGRGVALAGALVGGLALALALIPQYGPWLHFHRVLGGG